MVGYINSIEFSVALEAKVVALKLSFFWGGEGVVVIRFGLGLSSFSHASRFDVDVHLPTVISIGWEQQPEARAQRSSMLYTPQKYHLDSPNSCCHYYVLFRYIGALPP